ncbi:MAG: nucleoside deaminase [Desulfobulbales bacterium]|nr:nucleoside deaminase [Desulfobulbales bacterium]
MMIFPGSALQLPEWLNNFIASSKTFYAAIEERMELALELAARNINNDGSPFGAAIFERSSGRFIAPGINLVLQTNCSVFHAEIVAIILAQQKLATFDLGAEGLPEYELVTTTEPCAMCLGAIPWSGISSLVCGCREEDARHIGFDEGDKPDGWVQKLESRSITVTRNILRSKAKNILQKYIDQGGVIYNGKTIAERNI